MNKICLERAIALFFPEGKELAHKNHFPSIIRKPVSKNQAVRVAYGSAKKPVNKPKIEYVSVAQLDRASAS